MRRWLASSYRNLGLDVMMAVGLLRYGLDQPERVTRAFLHGCGLPLSYASISRLGTEFLVRWQLFAEERLLHLGWKLRPYVLQVDGTSEHGGATTLRAREARTGVTLLARQAVSENTADAVRFLLEVKLRYGDPVLVVRDGGEALKQAATAVFRHVPQQLDHFHFLVHVGEDLLAHHGLLKAALTRGKGLSEITAWAREKLPVKGRTVEEREAVGVRLILEWVEAGRRNPGGFPFHVPYLAVAHRAERAVGHLQKMVHGNVGRGVFVPEVVEAKRRLEALLDRSEVRGLIDRLGSEVAVWSGIRRAMKLERDRRSKEAEAPFEVKDVALAKEEIARVGEMFCGRGDWAVELWGKVEKRFREEEAYLWPRPELPAYSRLTVDLERDHRADRQSARRRTAGKDTGEEIGRRGFLYATFSLVRNPWFVREALEGVNLWEGFAQQDPEEVEGRVQALPQAGQRPRVAVSWEKMEERIEDLVGVIEGDGPLERGLEGWARSVGAMLDPAEA